MDQFRYLVFSLKKGIYKVSIFKKLAAFSPLCLILIHVLVLHRWKYAYNCVAETSIRPWMWERMKKHRYYDFFLAIEI